MPKTEVIGPETTLSLGKGDEHALFRESGLSQFNDEGGKDSSPGWDDVKLCGLVENNEVWLNGNKEEFFNWL